MKMNCWSVIAGEGSGSIVTINFGDQVERPQILSNPNLSEEEKKFVGEWSIYTSGSYWSLVVDGWMHVDATFDAQEIGVRLKVLIGDYVVSLEKLKESGILVVKFKSNAYLAVFPSDPIDESYFLSIGNKRNDAIVILPHPP